MPAAAPGRGRFIIPVSCANQSVAVARNRTVNARSHCHRGTLPGANRPGMRQRRQQAVFRGRNFLSHRSAQADYRPTEPCQGGRGIRLREAVHHPSATHGQLKHRTRFLQCCRRLAIQRSIETGPVWGRSDSCPFSSSGSIDRPTTHAEVRDQQTDGGQAHQHVDRARGSGHVAQERSHQIKAEQADQTPVQGADDDQDETDRSKRLVRM